MRSKKSESFWKLWMKLWAKSGSVIFVLMTVMVIMAVGCSGAKTPAGGGESSVPSSEETAMEVVFFDVGKGDCILLHKGASDVLLDTGYKETADEITDRLKERGIESLDAMIITHYHKDHVGGADGILREIPAEKIYLPDYKGDVEKCGDLLALIEMQDLAAVNVKTVEEFTLDGMRFRVNPGMIPYDSEEKNDNDASLTVEVFFGEDEWFLAGDIERDAIDVWLNTSSREYDILKLPHHGKKEKNSKDFIESVSPEIAVITDSTEEKAAKKILKILEEQEVDVYRSSEDGTITIIGNGKKEYTVKASVMQP